MLDRFDSRAERQRSAGGQPDARGPVDPIDAGCQSDQMASGAHDLVLRDLHPDAGSIPTTGFSIRPSPICSTPITRRWARAIRGPQRGLLSRPTVDDDRRLSRPCRRGDGPLHRTARRERGWHEAAPLIELGLHHEQQHQELILMDIKHVFSINPLLPAYQAPRRRSRRPTDAARLDRVCRRAGRDRPSRRRLRLRQRDAAAQGLARPVPPRHAAGDLRRISRLHRGRRLSATRNSGCRMAGRRCSEQGWEAPLYWRATDERLVASSRSAGDARLEPGRAGLPCQLLRGRRLCQLGRQAAADRGGMGDCRRGRAARRQFRRSAGTFIPAPSARRRRRAVPLRQMFGDVWEWTASPYIALSAVSRGGGRRSASTTASSCAIRWCCAAAPR